MEFNKIFITVGTTQFNDLIATVNTSVIASTLNQLKCKHLTIQIGTGLRPEPVPAFCGIDVDVYDLKPSIADDIQAADLVISHAGAGSCIEVLNAGKPLIVVVNENLMDNHQIELARQLCSDGYLLFCTPTCLNEMLLKVGAGVKLKPYERGSVKNFIKELDSLMGFV